MKIGKLTDEELKEHIFKYIFKSRSEVLKNSDIGIDTAVLDLGDNLAVLSIDPITGTNCGIGKLSVNISCNDVATEGAEPVGILLSVLAPPTCELNDLEEIMIEASRECREIGLDIIGGHTEITDAVNKVIVTSTVVGKINKSMALKRNRVENRDVVCVSKYIAMEGSYIVADAKKDILNLSDNELKEIEEMANGISIVKEAMIARNFGVKFMHDITEGGVYGALWESSEFLKKKFIIKKDLIPLKEISNKICNKLSLDPYRLISSGSLIMIFSQEDFEKFKSKCDEEDIKVTKIGYITDGNNIEVVSDEVEFITNTTVDELYKVV
ncbi:hydrogenase expression/formation protein HypE [Peptoniphilus asaccharolyticus DSM 20463]|uniref:Hydrogenase expression/formation protein HypE n=1 Tax=Peptoniphilus asaccharolyticus DSM 20463 TaxID=573058 RepID=A0A1W1UTI6_PEPAS|nr:AIR synthase related protein [Peptoniphilus asaccharolyticus]MBL7575165.1 hydrogenase maturation protein [Peptoniphilus asaccharolyticus]SMB84373.1 hydrogenase expression/formation protein HypE [Peptoniphilus asaccharolyticus DSM 20463]